MYITKEDLINKLNIGSLSILEFKKLLFDLKEHKQYKIQIDTGELSCILEDMIKLETEEDKDLFYYVKNKLECETTKLLDRKIDILYGDFETVICLGEIFYSDDDLNINLGVYLNYVVYEPENYEYEITYMIH